MQIVNHNFKISIINISIGTQRRTLRPPRSAPEHYDELIDTIKRSHWQRRRQHFRTKESKEERVKNWHKHFKDLLGREPVINDNHMKIKTIIEYLQYPSGPFTMDKLKKARSKITLGKASGLDNIPPEVIKLFNIEQPLLDFANDLLLNDCKPNQWSISNIIPVPNYHGISLNAITAKMVNRMILNRIQPVLDPHSRPNQNGF